MWLSVCRYIGSWCFYKASCMGLHQTAFPRMQQTAQALSKSLGGDLGGILDRTNCPINSQQHSTWRERERHRMNIWIEREIWIKWEWEKRTEQPTEGKTEWERERHRRETGENEQEIWIVGERADERYGKREGEREGERWSDTRAREMQRSRYGLREKNRNDRENR